MSAMLERDDLIRYLFNLGLTQSEMLGVLAGHGFIISARHLRRLLASLSLRRRGCNSDIADVIRFISEEIKSSGMLHGYRWMWEKCKEHGYTVARNDVQKIMSILDPDAAAFRYA